MESNETIVVLGSAPKSVVHQGQFISQGLLSLVELKKPNSPIVRR